LKTELLKGKAVPTNREALMTVKDVHEYLEGASPDGAGFGIYYKTTEQAVLDLVNKLSASNSINTDVALDQSANVRFSFLFDQKTFSLSASLGLSVDLRVWLHPIGKSAEPIVTAVYSIKNAQLEPIYDASISEFCWISKNAASMTLSSEQWGQDQALIDAGYIAKDGTADKQAFLQDIYYGFKWLNARNLLPSIIRTIPFPQVQRWFLPYALSFPFRYSVLNGYLIVLTDTVQNIFDDCGASQSPSVPPTATWELKAGSPPPASPFDNATPDFMLYVGAKNLVSWHARQIAPAVMLSGAGGGFVRWSYDIAVGVTSFLLDLIPAPNGGGLALHMDLRLAGQAAAWIDGPSGTRLSLASATITADGAVDATAIVHYVPSSGHIDLDADVGVSVDKNSVHLGAGGLFNDIQAEVIEFLLHRGAFKIDTSYHSKLHMPLVDLSDVTPRSRSQAFQRIGNRSMLTFYVDKSE
jgi:hypothetical protein